MRDAHRAARFHGKHGVEEKKKDKNCLKLIIIYLYVVPIKVELNFHARMLGYK